MARLLTRASYVLQAWKHDLPSYFKLEHPDKSMDNQYHYLAFHRQMLASEFYYTRILLHRPFILRRRDSTTYDYSRRAAIEAARADLIGRRDFQLNKPAHLGKLSVAAYWVLNSYIIIGIAILLDPTSSQAEELRNLLNVRPCHAVFTLPPDWRLISCSFYRSPGRHRPDARPRRPRLDRYRPRAGHRRALLAEGEEHKLGVAAVVADQHGRAAVPAPAAAADGAELVALRQLGTALQPRPEPKSRPAA